MAAKVFFESGRTDIAELKVAHSLLDQLLGTKVAPVLFAVALIAAGQSSTVTGTLAGQVVMEGYLQLRINPWIRRLLTRLLAIVPATLVIYLMGEDKVDSLLVLSQVILSLQLGFAIIPLIHFVSDKGTMQQFAIKLPIKIMAWAIAGVLVYLNGRMVVNELSNYFAHSASWYIQLLLTAIGLLFAALLLYITFFPYWPKRKKQLIREDLHEDSIPVPEITAQIGRAHV